MKQLQAALITAWAVAAVPAWAQEADDTPSPAASMPSDAPLAPEEAPPPLLRLAAAPVYPEEKPPLSTLRITTYALWGTAGATALTGTVFALLANSNYRRYKREYSTPYGDTTSLRSGINLSEAKALKDKVNAYKMVAIVSFSLATATAVGGTMLYFISPEWEASRTNISLLPTQGGALLSLGGSF